MTLKMRLGMTNNIKKYFGFKSFPNTLGGGVGRRQIVIGDPVN